MTANIGVKCKACGETISARNGEELLSKKKKHKLSCHVGFEEVYNDI